MCFSSHFRIVRRHSRLKSYRTVHKLELLNVVVPDFVPFSNTRFITHLFLVGSSSLSSSQTSVQTMCLQTEANSKPPGELHAEATAGLNTRDKELIARARRHRQRGYTAVDPGGRHCNHGDAERPWRMKCYPNTSVGRTGRMPL